MENHGEIDTVADGRAIQNSKYNVSGHIKHIFEKVDSIKIQLFGNL